MMMILSLQNKNKAKTRTKVQQKSRARMGQKVALKSMLSNKLGMKTQSKQKSKKIFSSVGKNNQKYQLESVDSSDQPSKTESNTNRFKKDGYTDSQGNDYKSSDDKLNKEKEIYGKDYKDGDDKKQVINGGQTYDQMKEAALADIKKNKLNDRQKIEKYPNMFYWEYQQSQDETENQAKLNSVAQTKFDTSAEGTDDFKDLIYEGEMLVRLNYYSTKENDKDLKPFYLRLNDKNLYLSDKQTSGYRGINASIPIKNVYDPSSDDVRMGQCCQQVGVVAPQLYGDVNNQAAYQCFSVDDFNDKISWTICNTDNDTINDLRQYIIMAVIKYGLSKFGIYGLEELMKFQKIACERPIGWNFKFQSRWPCMCPEGMMQSPINIPTINVINSTKIFTDFRYWDFPVTSYVEIVTPQESYAKGLFGSVTYKDKTRKRTSYKSEEIRFKFPSEHQVNGQEYPGEMQIIHSNGDSRLIVSIFIGDEKKHLSMMKKVFQTSTTKADMSAFGSGMSADDFFDAVSGGSSDGDDTLLSDQQKLGDKFLVDFQTAKWLATAIKSADLDKNPKEVCIDTDNKFNLFDIFKQKDTLTRSFYTYQGSDTKPPCKEDVQWIILKDPYIMSTIQLKAFKNKVQLESGSDNNRKIMPLSDREIMGYDECPKFDMKVPPPTVDINAQLVKAKVHKHWYAIVHPGTKTMFDDESGKFQTKKNKYFIKNENGWDDFIKDQRVKPKKLDDSEYYHMQSLDENDMDASIKNTPGLAQIKQDLRFQLGSWLVDNRDKIMKRNMEDIDNKYGRDKINGDVAS